MRALVYDRYAADDDFASILQIRNIPEPVPGPSEVVFEVKAAALNYDDIWLSLIHISEPRDRTRSRMPSSA